ncbi:MAG: DUF2516 family protein [Bifidobacteriaceae bacterium]|nr:DUF2516 family protein [Bifidobacteriaceae bacterium]
MNFFSSVGALIFGAVGLAAFALEVWALVDALIRPRAAFPYGGKASKGLWVALTAAAALVGFGGTALGRGGFGGLLSIAAVVLAIVYLVDVRPAVRTYPKQRPGSSGGAGGYGQRGGW